MASKVKTPIFESSDGITKNHFALYRLRDAISVLRKAATRTIPVTIDLEGNLPLISDSEYGTTDLWWLIAEVNNIIDPINDVKEGMSLLIPNPADVDAALSRVSPNSSSTTSANFASASSQSSSKSKTVLLPRSEL